MKHLCFLVILFLSLGYSQAQEITKEQITFVNEFISTIQAHQVDKVSKYLEKGYLRKLKKRHKKRKDKAALVSELFKFNDYRPEGEWVYDVMPIDEILRIEVAEVQESENGSFLYIFRIRDAKQDVFSSLKLTRNGNRFGFSEQWY